MSLAVISDHLSKLMPEARQLAPLDRILVCLGIWQMFDKLRSAEAPFDRSQFLHYLMQTSAWSAGRPRHAVSQNEAAAARHEVERFTGQLYSQCWVVYDQPQFNDTVSFFERRLRNNGIDLSVIRGGRCLDAGCGGGRFTIAMHYLGAAHATGVDIGPDAIADAKKRRDTLKIPPSAVEFTTGSLLKLPSDWSGSFDFICSNGVLHHTVDPRGALAEVSRVLKPNGHAYIYVYGAGGLHWDLVEWIREVLGDIEEGDVRNLLHLLDVPVGKIFHIMDHWFVPNYETLTRVAFEERLRSVGFRDLHYMPRGLYLYDSSERRYRYPEDADLMGDGDLRYMVRK